MDTWPIDRMRPYERNSRRHSAEQTEQIAASIREWGWTITILAASDGMVLAGHGRLAVTCHCIFIQRQLESRGFVRQVALMEQRTIGGAGRGCAADRPLR